MSAGCARRVMRKHILRIFCALKARIFPTFFHDFVTQKTRIL